MTQSELVAKTPLEPFNEVGAAYNCLKALLWLVFQLETPRRHAMLEHILEIAEELQAMEEEMSRVVRVWRMEEEPVNAHFACDYDTGPHIVCYCPQCERWFWAPVGEPVWNISCPCGAQMRLRQTVTVEQLEG